MIDKELREQKKLEVTDIDMENRYRVADALGYDKRKELLTNELGDLCDQSKEFLSPKIDLLLIPLMARHGKLPQSFLTDGARIRTYDIFIASMLRAQAGKLHPAMVYADECLKAHGLEPIVFVFDRFDKNAKYYYLDDPDIDIYQPWEYVWEPMLYGYKEFDMFKDIIDT